jgi:hypothetical protein
MGHQDNDSPYAATLPVRRRPGWQHGQRPQSDQLSLGGNMDNDHSQTSYLGYLAGNLICWCSTAQGSISTSTAESEIKAVNHTLKAEVIANRGILNMMGWKQESTRREEDNQAAIYHSKTTHMTRNLRHLELCTNWIKEKARDGTCILVKVTSADNNSDIGTKRVPISIFTIVDLTTSILTYTTYTDQVLFILYSRFNNASKHTFTS